MKKFDQGDLNQRFNTRTGFSLEPERFTVRHLNYKLIEQLVKPNNVLISSRSF